MAKKKAKSKVTFTSKSWNGSSGRYKDAAAYCAACLVDRNKRGKSKTKALCKLPIREPNGVVNTNALSAAYGALRGARKRVILSVKERKRAAVTLLRMYRLAKKTVPDGLLRMAGKK